MGGPAPIWRRCLRASSCEGAQSFNRERRMARDPLFILIVIAIAVVVGILFTGIGGFVTGKNDGKKSNKLMQARVIAQFAAVAVIVLIVWLRSKG